MHTRKTIPLTLLDSGELRLAPLYDVAPTLLLYAPSNNAGHNVGGQIRLGYITLEHLTRDGVAWGMDDEDSRQTAVSALEALGAAAHSSQTPERLDFLRKLVPARVDDLLSGGPARRQ